MKLILFIISCIFSVFAQNVQYEFLTKYIDVPLDHFSFTNNLTFKLRYFVNDTFHTVDGPIFFYTGNEGDINMFAQNTGFIFDIAPKFNALIIFAEHRYYGESLPFGDLSYSSLEYLGYLSSTQALADFVYLINHLQKSHSNGNRTALRVVAFGGSYGGMLSAYLRMKYPYSVVGAIASSAPIWMFPYLTDCGSFSLTTTRDFEEIGGKACRGTIQKSWQAIRNVMNTASGRLWLSNLFKFCSPLETEDIAVLLDWFAEIYYNLAEVNYPYSTSFLVPLPPYPLKAFCSHIKVDEYNNDFDLLETLEGAFQIYTNYTGTTKCNDLSKPTSDDLSKHGFDFQICTDMVQNICSTDEDMFENYVFDFDKFSQDCFEEFGIRPRSAEVPLLLYGGKNLKAASNIVFSNGFLDPWSGMGVLENISSTVLAVIVKDGAHHFDLRGSHENDTESVKEVRRFHVGQISRWINEHYNKDSY